LAAPGNGPAVGGESALAAGGPSEGLESRPEVSIRYRKAAAQASTPPHARTPGPAPGRHGWCRRTACRPGTGARTPLPLWTQGSGDSRWAGAAAWHPFSR